MFVSSFFVSPFTEEERLDVVSPLLSKKEIGKVQGKEVRHGNAKLKEGELKRSAHHPGHRVGSTENTPVVRCAMIAVVRRRWPPVLHSCKEEEEGVEEGSEYHGCGPTGGKTRLAALTAAGAG